MHWSVSRTFETFVESYLAKTGAISVLEVGSANVNGGLRDKKLQNMSWVGVDLDDAPGVDIAVKVGAPLPFENAGFDLVLASSVFEHDIQFWNTFLEMSRVLKRDGLLFITVPSQGYFHRHTLDVFRFYPDAGVALAKWADSHGLPLRLVESFTTKPENGIWADFVAVFAFQPEKYQGRQIGGTLNGENWILGDDLQQSTYQEIPYDLRRITELEAELLKTKSDLDRANFYIHSIINSRSSRLVKELRMVVLGVRRLFRK